MTTGPPSSVKSFVVGALDGFRALKKPYASLRVVRLAEGATERPVFEGTRSQARNNCPIAWTGRSYSFCA
jgi:hypothetical protein